MESVKFSFMWDSLMQIYEKPLRSKALSIVYSCTSMLGAMTGVYKVLSVPLQSGVLKLIFYLLSVMKRNECLAACIDILLFRQKQVH